MKDWIKTKALNIYLRIFGRDLSIIKIGKEEYEVGYGTYFCRMTYNNKFKKEKQFGRK